MNEVLKSVLITEHEMIGETIRMMDSHAEIYLFGPGAVRSGLPLDIYIYSHKLNKTQSHRLKQAMNDRCRLFNIDGIFFLDENQRENTKSIALAI